MGMYDNIDEYNKVRQQLQNAEAGVIPMNPSEDLIKSFMSRYSFSISYDERRFNVLLIDDIGRKIYAYPQSITGGRQWALRTMYLIVSLRNMKENWRKEKDSHKRRKIYSKMNCVKGELNQYVVS